MLAFKLSENSKVNPNFSLISEEAGLFLYQIDFAGSASDEELEFSVLLPMLGMHSAFHALSNRDSYVYQWWNVARKNSSFYNGAPFYTICDKDIVFANVALSDAVNNTSIRYAVNDFDEEEKVAFIIRLQAKAPMQLRVDLRPLPLWKSMKELSAWWQGFYPFPEQIPAAAEEPLYSTWYNFHQHPNTAALVPELRLAKDLGFGSVILDDGWQFDGRGTGDYINCGDWAFSKEKFPNGLAEIKELGMPLAMWFCVPFVGWNTEAYRHFKDKLLYDYGRNHCGILDVRCKEAREFILNTLCDFVKRSGLDGLKLDFIDSFRVTEETPEPNADMDEPDLSRAVIRLLEDLRARLEELRPGALIEFRQDYIGPAICRFANMLRVGDCCFDSNLNRRRLADLRLLQYPIAIHSDMLYWAKDETPKNCARQLINVLFSVPQISVLLTQSSEDQLSVIREFIRYWKENRDILLHGDFIPYRQDLDYPMLSARGVSKSIYALYADVPLEIAGAADIFNATDKELIYLDLTAPCAARALDAAGNIVVEYELSAGCQKLRVPVGGRVELR